jgi:hypothetical protein
MEKTDDGVYKLVLPYQYEIPGAYGNVIFNYNGQQFDAGRISPGQKMIYTADGKWIAYEEPQKGTMGDVNGDSVVNINDVTLVQRAIARARVLNALQIKLADVSGDGKISIDDATCIQKYIAKYTEGCGKTGEIVTV